MKSALCWEVLPGMGSPLKYGDKPSDTLRPDKVDFLFVGVWGTSVSKSFLVMGRASCSLSLSSAWILSGVCCPSS